jgi:serine/threonine protein kinase
VHFFLLFTHPTPFYHFPLATIITNYPLDTPTSSLQNKELPQEFIPQQDPALYNEFVPQYDASQYTDHTNPAAMMQAAGYDPFSGAAAMQTLTNATNQMTMGGYQQDHSTAQSNAYYQNSSGFQHPPNYHLYSAMAPYPANLLPYQRVANDFFLPDQLREELQRKSEATRQVLSNSNLPMVESYHTLVPLDINARSTSLFGYQSWVYKATNKDDGNTYALRRLKDFRLSNAEAIVNTVRQWKKINNGNIVTVHNCFTTQVFGDNSLIFVTDYFPLAKTLAETHPPYTPHPQNRYGRHQQHHRVEEDVLWSYLVQLGSALKTIHSQGLAARTLDPTKIIVTSKNWIRLSACAVLDVVQYSDNRPMAELQQEDLVQLGKLILKITNAASNPSTPLNKAIEQLGRTHSLALKDAVSWLIMPQHQFPQTPTSPIVDGSAPPPLIQKDIDAFLQGIQSYTMSAFDKISHERDELIGNLARELENGRLFRLLAKLNCILERPEYDISGTSSSTSQHQQHGRATTQYPGGPPSASALTTSPHNFTPGQPHHHSQHNPHLPHHSQQSHHPSPLVPGQSSLPAHTVQQQNQHNAWSETGERYILKLFRDYVFHPVDSEGRPLLDLGHIITTLNKLDAGTEEKVMLTSRDEQNVIVVSYRELRRAVEGAWSELMHAASGQGSVGGSHSGSSNVSSHAHGGHQGRGGSGGSGGGGSNMGGVGGGITGYSNNYGAGMGRGTR